MKNASFSPLSVVLLAAVLVNAAPARASGISPGNQQRLGALRDSIRTWVRYCDGAMNYGGGCDQGDLALFAGLMCLSGEKDRCEDVRRSQAGDGSWWRAPKRIGETGRPVFSRDQTMGLLAYFTATREKTIAQHWVDWVVHNGRKWPDTSPLREEQPLPPGLTFFSVCKDDFHVNCLITPPLWGFMGRVWQWMGVDPTSQMHSGETLDEDEVALVGETLAPQKPYERHLAAVEVFIRKMVGRHNFGVSRAAGILAHHEPNNAFFRFLSDGPTDAVAQLALAQCPAQPLVSEPNDWLWMADNPPASAFRTSMGWDCIFMTNLLLDGVIHKQLGF
jgi:hypothetical protein